MFAHCIEISYSTKRHNHTPNRRHNVKYTASAPKKLRYYRSYKTFDIENFNDDIEQIKINQTCHEVDSVYNEYEKDFINVLNKHAPIKSRYQRKKPLPCMNQELRRAVTENKCYILNLQNVRATKIGKNSESKEIL